MPKSDGLKIGRVISRIGNEAVVSFPDSEKPQDLKTADALYGKKISIGNSEKGRISDIVGRVDSPYMVIKLNKK